MMATNETGAPAGLAPGSWRAFPDAAALAEALADHLAATARAAVQSRGRGTLVLSGGSSPVRAFERLGPRADVPWPRVTLTLSDERWVPVDDAASNEAMLRRTLAPALAAGATLVGLKSDGDCPADGVPETNRRLLDLDRPFDLLLLGMGEDGHTASLFPGGQGLAEGLAPVTGRSVAAVVPAIPGPARISMTLPTLLETREIVLLITGAAKRRVLEQALQPGPVEEMPVRAVLRQTRVPLTVWWTP